MPLSFTVFGKPTMRASVNMILCLHFAGSIKKPGIAQANLPSDPQGQVSEWGTRPT